MKVTIRISLGMATLLQKEAKLKHDLEELKCSLRHNNIALEKVSTDKDCLLKYFYWIKKLFFCRFSDELLSEKEVSKNRNKDMKFLGEKSQQYSKMASNLQVLVHWYEFSCIKLGWAYCEWIQQGSSTSRIAKVFPGK